MDLNISAPFNIMIGYNLYCGATFAKCAVWEFVAPATHNA